MHAPEVLPVAGQGWLAWNDLLAAGLRAILPLAVRAQDVHFVDEVWVRVAVDRRSVRPADRGALLGADRELRRLVDAHVWAEASRRQSKKASLRIIMQDLSALCARNNRPIYGSLVEVPAPECVS